MRGTSSDDCAVVCVWRCSLNNNVAHSPQQAAVRSKPARAWRREPYQVQGTKQAGVGDIIEAVQNWCQIDSNALCIIM